MIKLECEQVAFRHPGGGGVSAVKFQLHPGEALALIGPNGAGKSSLIDGLLGLVPFTSGSITIGAEHYPATGASLHLPRGTFGYLPQSFTLDPHFPISLAQMVMLGRYPELGWLRWPGRVDRHAVRNALERVKLSALARSPFGALSGGQRQRGLLARALVAKPNILLLDEPFNGLDADSRLTLTEILGELKAAGTSVILSTHDVQLALNVCELAVTLNGSQQASGPVAEVLRAGQDIIRRLDEEHFDAHENHHDHSHDLSALAGVPAPGNAPGSVPAPGRIPDHNQ